MTTDVIYSFAAIVKDLKSRLCERMRRGRRRSHLRRSTVKSDERARNGQEQGLVQETLNVTRRNLLRGLCTKKPETPFVPPRPRQDEARVAQFNNSRV